MTHLRSLLSRILYRVAAWIDPNPCVMATMDPRIPLVAYDGDGNRVLVRVDPERIQYVITATEPTRDDFERDAAARSQEVFGV